MSDGTLTVPDAPPTDARGLPMRTVYPADTADDARRDRRVRRPDGAAGGQASSDERVHRCTIE
jgi:hypothetical protein